MKAPRSSGDREKIDEAKTIFARKILESMT